MFRTHKSDLNHLYVVEATLLYNIGLNALSLNTVSLHCIAASRYDCGARNQYVHTSYSTSICSNWSSALYVYRLCVPVMITGNKIPYNTKKILQECVVPVWDRIHSGYRYGIGSSNVSGKCAKIYSAHFVSLKNIVRFVVVDWTKGLLLTRHSAHFLNF